MTARKVKTIRKEHVLKSSSISAFLLEQGMYNAHVLLPIKEEVLSYKQSAPESHLYFLPMVRIVIRQSDKNTTCGGSYNFGICYFKLIFGL